MNRFLRIAFLATFLAQPFALIARADARSDAQYAQELVTQSVPSLVAERGLIMASAAVDCGANALEVALLGLAETAPLSVTFVGMVNEEEGSSLVRDQVVHARGSAIKYANVPFVLGSAISVFGTGLYDTLANLKSWAWGGRAVRNFEKTKGVAGSTYLVTEEKWLASFKTEGSDCVQDLKKFRMNQRELLKRMPQAVLKRVQLADASAPQQSDRREKTILNADAKPELKENITDAPSPSGRGD
jgi:hypothetical protein